MTNERCFDFNSDISIQNQKTFINFGKVNKTKESVDEKDNNYGICNIIFVMDLGGNYVCNG